MHIKIGVGVMRDSNSRFCERKVFVVGDKIYKIADQKMAALEQHAGHKVEIEGTLKGDTIAVTKVTMLPVK